MTEEEMVDKEEVIMDKVKAKVMVEEGYNSDFKFLRPLSLSFKSISGFILHSMLF